MCDGCEHKTACKALGLVNFMPQPSPCFEPAAHVSKFEVLGNAPDTFDHTSMRFASEPRTPVPDSLQL